jgi:hypothetical protein
MLLLASSFLAFQMQIQAAITAKLVKVWFGQDYPP